MTEFKKGDKVTGEVEASLEGGTYVRLVGGCYAVHAQGLSVVAPSHPAAVPDGLVERLRANSHRTEYGFENVMCEAADWIESHASAPRVTSPAAEKAMEIWRAYSSPRGDVVGSGYKNGALCVARSILEAEGYVLDQPAPVWRYASDAAVGGSDV